MKQRIFKDRKGNIIIYDNKKLYNYGINKLSKMEYTRKELFDKMNTLQSDVSIINDVLDRLESSNYLSTERKAKMIINQYINRESINKIKYRLKEKGVDIDLINLLFEDIEESENEEDSEEYKSYLLLIKKFKCYDKDKYNKYVSFLLSKGYSFDIIKKGLKLFKEVDVKED